MMRLISIPRCEGVSQVFYDLSLRMRNSCWEVCNYKRPELSPADCQEKCPELHACLIKKPQALSTQRNAALLAFENIEPSALPRQTPVSPTCPEDLHFNDHLVYGGIILFLLVALIVSIVKIFLLKDRLRRLSTWKKNTKQRADCHQVGLTIDKLPEKHSLDSGVHLPLSVEEHHVSMSNSLITNTAPHKSVICQCTPNGTINRSMELCNSV